MGQAKRRGSFEERRKQAIEREQAQEQARRQRQAETDAEADRRDAELAQTPEGQAQLRERDDMRRGARRVMPWLAASIGLALGTGRR